MGDEEKTKEAMTTESVAPVKFHGADGIVYERTGEKREPKPGELHWCDATRPAPYAFEWPPVTHWMPREDWPPPDCQMEHPLTLEGGPDPMYRDPTLRPCVNCGKPRVLHPLPDVCPQFHKCAIWKVSEDQGWKPPELPEASHNPIDQLIQRVQLTGGDLEGANIPVLAMLYQAKALERIAVSLDELSQVSVEIQELRRVIHSVELELLKTVIQNRGGSTPLQTEASGSGAVASVKADVLVMGSGFTRPIVNGDHAEPTRFEPGAAKDWLAVHRFRGADWMIFCPQCGGGRLHPIHQV